jgi:hypothetical protein
MRGCGLVSGGRVSGRAGRGASRQVPRGAIPSRSGPLATFPFLFPAALLLAALLWLAPGPASAQVDAGSYVQQGVPAEASAENGVLARERALASGRRIAWERLAGLVGAPANLPDSQIEDMVASIVIEQERALPTRYAGRITVRFNPARVRAAVAGRAPGGSGTSPGGMAGSGPASTWLEAIAIYGSMTEWLELRRRLQGAAPVASVEVVAIATDAAQLRIGLRGPAPAAAPELAANGVALEPAMGPAGETWRVGLASGG